MRSGDALDDCKDRRGVLVELTPRGRALIDDAIDAHLALYEELVSGVLNKAEQRTFIELLRKQTVAFEEGRVGHAQTLPLP